MACTWLTNKYEHTVQTIVLPQYDASQKHTHRARPDKTRRFAAETRNEKESASYTWMLAGVPGSDGCLTLDWSSQRRCQGLGHLLQQ